MRDITTIYVDGSFVSPHGSECATLFNPATEEVIGRVRLGDRQDAQRAIAAAKCAFPSFSQTSLNERRALLERLALAVEARRTVLIAAMVEEFGSPITLSGVLVDQSIAAFRDMARIVESYAFTRWIGSVEVEQRPLGVAAAITPWNANYLFICSKLATALAAGCTIVIKPSEMSAIQTHLLTECFHEAGLPNGVFNIVNGYGHTVGVELSTHPDIAKISFTGSTNTGRSILQAAADTMKRVTLELGGKGPTILLDDADLEIAIPQALGNGFVNSGQACVAGTRILVPLTRLDDTLARLRAVIKTFKVGQPSNPEVSIGPLVNEKQWERVQSYIRLGLEEGAALIAGGLGRPEGTERGWFVKPTLFSDVTNQMRIARDEIFGPVLCVIPYQDEADAIAIANDTPYGLQAYILSSDIARARRVAHRLESGRVVVNAGVHEPFAPFGGFKQSGIGRECGDFGLEAFLEPRAIMI